MTSPVLCKFPTWLSRVKLKSEQKFKFSQFTLEMENLHFWSLPRGGSSPSDWVRRVSCLVQIFGEKNHDSKQPSGGSLKTFVIALILIFQVATQKPAVFFSQMSIKNSETSVKKNTAGFWIAFWNIKTNANEFLH